MTFEPLWEDLAPIGLSAATGGYRRQGFSSAAREAQDWFLEAAHARGLQVESDELGTMTVAWWRPEGVAGPGVLTGSHLDSVVDGGAYDGALGVVSGLAAIDLLSGRGVTPVRPIGVAVFAEEEGSRFGVPCLGSRVVTGGLGLADLQVLRDGHGTWFLDALADHGIHPDPELTTVASPDLAERVGCFVELHVEQGRGLVELDAPVGVGTGIWPHGRWRFDVTGQADHAGSTRMEDRRDPMLTWARTVLAADEHARRSGQRATFGRVEVAPNGTNTIPSRVSGWLDARAEGDDALDALVDAVRGLADERAAQDGTALTVTTESRSPAVRFDTGLVSRLAAPGLPALPTQAGHDAGVLAAAGIPTAMLFVRNPTGISHAPEEHAEAADCLAGVEALADALAALAS